VNTEAVILVHFNQFRFDKSNYLFVILLSKHPHSQVVVQPALQWLEDNQDKPMEEILAASGPDPETDPSIEPAALKDGEVARSLKCDECGKKFRSMAQAEFHGNKTYVHVPSSFAP
jgi:hypothetical protein